MSRILRGRIVRRQRDLVLAESTEELDAMIAATEITRQS